MKLEPNMYVRTKNGCICQILRTTYSKYLSRNKELCYEVDRPINVNMELYDEDILKASHNIIDLIEVGDYVNGSLVVEVGEDRVFTNIYYEDGYYNSFVGADEDWNSSYVSDYSQEIICDYEIKSIVTREQFEQMQYKVGE